MVSRRTDKAATAWTGVHDQDPKLDTGRLPEDALRPLAVPDLATTLRQVLESSEREDADQVVSGFVLRALTLGEPMPGFHGTPARDRPRRDAVVRHQPARHWMPSSTTAPTEDDVPGGRAPTPCTTSGAVRSAISNRELLGTLLARLYPEGIPPDELWNYLLDQPTRLIGRYYMFWRCDLFDRTPEGRFPDLLETVGSRLPGLRSALHSRFLDDLPVALLARTLESVGDRTPVSRLLRLAPHRRRVSTRAPATPPNPFG